MDKKAIQQAVISLLEEERDGLQSSFESNKEHSNEAPGPMQSRYDTRRSETAALASAQMLEVRRRGQAISYVKNMRLRDQSQIDVGTVLRVEELGEEKLYFMVPGGAGGYVLEEFGIETLACNAPVGRALLDKRVGDKVEVEVPAGIRRIKILSVE